MAQTDARPGFRLPWSTERSNDEQTNMDGTTQVDETAEADETEQADNVDGGYDAPTSVDPNVDDGPSDVTTSDPAETNELSGSAAGPSARRPTKFMEDLSKAMQVAAEEARTRTLGQFQADAKSHIEGIHTRLTTETADLRRRADDDVAAVREWSKVEIARIREETEGRISARKSNLESEIAMHAAQIEREIEIVQGRVTEFETEMADFFERLLAEGDPTRIATMAERLPEPPPFDTVAEFAAATLAEEIATANALAPEDTTEDAADDTTAESSFDGAETSSDGADGVVADDGETAALAEGIEGVSVPDGFEIDREAAFAAVQAAAEAATSIDRDSDEITEIGDDDLAARLAGLVPAKAAKVHSSEATSTQVVVVGLVSVASIASFKRHLGRVSGVQSVGVSSGPDGEFMFAVHHSADVVLRDAIPSLPSFQARITGTADGVLNVTAHDPESDH